MKMGRAGWSDEKNSVQINPLPGLCQFMALLLLISNGNLYSNDHHSSLPCAIFGINHMELAGKMS